MLKMKINLHTVAQWQRARKGDDDRYFPWGDDYQEEHCNTVETGLKQPRLSIAIKRGSVPTVCMTWPAMSGNGR